MRQGPDLVEAAVPLPPEGGAPLVVECADIAVSRRQPVPEHLHLDAVFVASDLMASGAYTALKEAGRTIPADVAVGGFDDSSLASMLEPPLSPVHQPLQRISEEMVRLLLQVIEGKDPLSVIVPTHLVLRAST